MKKILFLLLLPFAVQGQVNYDSLYNALHINYFSSPYGFVKIILPLDTARVSWQTNNIKGSTAYINNKIYINNGSTWQPTASYFAGFGLGLTGANVFYVDTSKIVTHLSLTDSLGLYATKVALTDTAGSIRTQNATFATHTALVDTAAAIRASSSSTAGLATTVALTDTAAALRTYAQTNLNDTATAIRSAIPSIAGLATTVALTDTAIARAATAQTNLVDTAAAIRGSFPSTAGLATTVALTDTAIARALTAKTNLDDTASTLRGWANGKFSTTTGTVTSVGLIGSTTLSVTGTASPITGAGTYSLSVPASVPLAGSPTTTTQSAGTNNTTIATTAFVNTVVATTSVNATPLVPGGNITLSAVGSIVAGSNISTTTSGSTVTVNALPATGTSQIQYNKSGNFASASKSLIDSADGTNIFICQTFTTIPTNGNPGMLKIIADSLYGYEQLMTISGTTGLATPLQTSNVHHYDGRMYSNGGAVLADGFYNSAISNSGTPSFVLRTYDASNCAPNFLSIKTSTSASPNSSTEWWYGFSGRDGMITSSIFTGGSVLVMDFHLAAYFSTQRAFFGYTSTSTQMTTTGDPSGVLNIVGAGKDAADVTLQIMFNNGSGTATKVNTGITPTVNDRYRVTVWLPSNTTTEYVTVEKFTTTTYTIVGASNTGKIPTAGTLMYLHMMVNTAAASTISSLNIHWIKEEQYEY